MRGYVDYNSLPTSEVESGPLPYSNDYWLGEQSVYPPWWRVVPQSMSSEVPIGMIRITVCPFPKHGEDSLALVSEELAVPALYELYTTNAKVWTSLQRFPKLRSLAFAPIVGPGFGWMANQLIMPDVEALTLPSWNAALSVLGLVRDHAAEVNRRHALAALRSMGPRPGASYG